MQGINGNPHITQSESTEKKQLYNSTAGSQDIKYIPQKKEVTTKESAEALTERPVLNPAEFIADITSNLDKTYEDLLNEILFSGETLKISLEDSINKFILNEGFVNTANKIIYILRVMEINDTADNIQKKYNLTETTPINLDKTVKFKIVVFECLLNQLSVSEKYNFNNLLSEYCSKAKYPITSIKLLSVLTKLFNDKENHYAINIIHKVLKDIDRLDVIEYIMEHEYYRDLHEEEKLPANTNSASEQQAPLKREKLRVSMIQKNIIAQPENNQPAIFYNEVIPSIINADLFYEYVRFLTEDEKNTLIAVIDTKKFIEDFECENKDKDEQISIILNNISKSYSVERVIKLFEFIERTDISSDLKTKFSTNQS